MLLAEDTPTKAVQIQITPAKLIAREAGGRRTLLLPLLLGLSSGASELYPGVFDRHLKP